MLLAIDIGNTNTVLALHDNSSWVVQHRIKTRDFNLEFKLKSFLMENKPDNCIISSVVPNLTDKVSEIVEENCNIECFLINNKIKTGLVQASIPNELGSDILCNLTAAHYFYPDKYVTVADFGTAFTTATVSPNGEVLGVTIAPGMMTSVKALYEKTAQIPIIRLELPETVLGRDTVSSIRAGVVFGFAGQLNAILEQIHKEINTEPFLVITGGFSKYVGPYVKHEHKADIDFTLEGARIAWLLNK